MNAALRYTNRADIRKLTVLFAFTYMVSYITKTNFGAVISEMVTNLGVKRDLLALSITGSFITYGAGQVLSGVLGDRFSPKKLIGFGLAVTTAMNTMMSMLSEPYIMLVAWCINGFAQSFMWPPMVRLMSARLTDLEFKRTNEKIMWGSSAGTVIVYLMASVLIWIFNSWRAMFVFSAVCGGVMLLFWCVFCEDVGVQKRVGGKTEGAEKMSLKSIFFLVVGVMIGVIIMGMIRDAVTTWLPSYLEETYGMSNASSIMSGVILPIFAVIAFSIATWLYQNKIKNPLTGAAIFFGVGLVGAVGWGALSGTNAVASIFFAALLTASMHGVNLMLICMVPKAFDRFGNVSTVSGVVNACTYIGSAISTFGIAALSESESFGWEGSLIIWIGATIVGVVVSLACIVPWRKNFMAAK